MPSVAITVEGVLRKTSGGAPIPVGIDLYYGLATRAKLVLLTGERSREALEYWLLSEGMHEHARVVYSDVVMADLSSGGERLAQLAAVRQFGHKIDLVIEPDPQVSARLLIAGYNVCTFTHAEYAVPAWRPDAKLTVTPWRELEAQVARENLLRRQDEREKEAK